MRIRNIAVAISMALCIAVAIAIGLVARAELGIRRHVREEVESASFTWSVDLERWALSQNYDGLAVLPSDTIDAARLLWPAGLGVEGLHCPRYHALGPSAPVDSSSLRAAATCPALDTFRRVAQASRLNLLEVADGVAPADLLLTRAPFWGVESGINALVASAQLDQARHMYEAAERDLQIGLRLALLLLQQSGSLAGMEIGHARVSVILEHLEHVYGNGGNGDKAQLVASLRSSLPPFETCRSILNTALPRSGAVDAGLASIADVARREDLPLAMRVRALYVVVHGHYGSPLGLLFGPSSDRHRVLTRLAESRELNGWIQPVQELTAPSYRERIVLLTERLATGSKW